MVPLSLPKESSSLVALPTTDSIAAVTLTAAIAQGSALLYSHVGPRLTPSPKLSPTVPSLPAVKSSGF